MFNAPDRINKKYICVIVTMFIRVKLVYIIQAGDQSWHINGTWGYTFCMTPQYPLWREILHWGIIHKDQLWTVICTLKYYAWVSTVQGHTYPEAPQYPRWRVGSTWRQYYPIATVRRLHWGMTPYYRLWGDMSASWCLPWGIHLSIHYEETCLHRGLH